MVGPERLPGGLEALAGVAAVARRDFEQRRPDLKMLLTRLGWHSTMVVTGDPHQSDLLPGVSGLADISARLEAVDDIAVVRLAERDIVRHPLVASMIGVL